MRVLLLAATEAEIAGCRAWIEAHEHPVDVLVAGVGIVATTFALTRKLDMQSYDLVIQGGVAGAVSTELELGEVIRVEREVLIDFGAEDRNGDTLDLSTLGLDFPDGHDDDGSLGISFSQSLSLSLPLRRVTGGTVMRGSGSQPTIDRLRRQYPRVAVESMEGAALAYVCANKGQSALQLRAISNYVTERNRAGWRIDLAVSKLNEALIELITELLNVNPVG